MANNPPDPVSSAVAQDPPATRARDQDDGSYTKLFQVNEFVAIN